MGGWWCDEGRTCDWLGVGGAVEKEENRKISGKESEKGNLLVRRIKIRLYKKRQNGDSIKS